jgi:hypothetical protein
MKPGKTVRPAAAPRRTTGGADLGKEASKEARRLAAVLLEVLAGARTPLQGAEALQVSLPRYYQLEARGLRGLLGACEARPRGRQPDAGKVVAALEQDKARLQRELARQQSLARLTQRVVGLSPPAAPPRAAGKKGRQRKPVARALAVAARLKQEAAPPGDSGMSTSTATADAEAARPGRPAGP